MTNTGNLTNIGNLAAASNELLNEIRGGAIADMKTEHEQLQSQFTANNDAAIAQFNSEKQAALFAADNDIELRRAALDSIFADATAPVTQRIHYYDRKIHSKTSLNIVADRADITRSDWVAVPAAADGVGYQNYPHHSGLTILNLTRAYSRNGGYPDYVSDTSQSRMQFIVAGDGMTSDEINTAIAATGAAIADTGGWNNAPFSVPVSVLTYNNDTSSYKRLYVRFINRPHIEGRLELAQEITQWGGDSHFAVDTVVNYPRVPS
ncbi:hypothetical protein JL49_09010 [Pseudoalteromonas luteoviolacea]|nr:hypothetical protein JL49_09010 [Pseudoalteromonas luteoviolacea]